MGRRRVVALVATFVLVASACGGDDDEDAVAGEDTSSTTTAGASGTSVPFQLGDAQDLGPGAVAGVHPEAPIVYVLVEDPGSDVIGCEGVPRTFLWAHPLDDSDIGARRRATPGDADIAGEVVVGGADGAVALVEQCEGFLVAIATASASADGTFTGVTVVEPTGLGEDGQLAPSTISWGADGRSWIGIFQRYDGPEDIVQIAADDGTTTVLATTADATAAVELADGTLVVSDPTGTSIGDGEPITSRQAYELRVAPSGDRVAVFDQDGVTIIGPDQAPRRVFERDASIGTWSPTGDALAFLDVSNHDAIRAVLVHLGDTDRPSASATEHELSADAGFAAPLFTADGTSVVYSDSVPHPDGYPVPEVMVRRVR